MFIFFPHLVQWFNNSSPLMTSFKNDCYGHQKSTKGIPPGGPSSAPGCRALPVGVVRAEGAARRSPPSPTRNDGPPPRPPDSRAPPPAPPSSHTRLCCPSPAELGPDVSSRWGNVVPREPWGSTLSDSAGGAHRGRTLRQSSVLQMPTR